MAWVRIGGFERPQDYPTNCLCVLHQGPPPCHVLASLQADPLVGRYYTSRLDLHSSLRDMVAFIGHVLAVGLGVVGEHPNHKLGARKGRLDLHTQTHTNYDQTDATYVSVSMCGCVRARVL
jgi:hypothetical protein